MNGIIPVKLILTVALSMLLASCGSGSSSGSGTPQPQPPAPEPQPPESPAPEPLATTLTPATQTVFPGQQTDFTLTLTGGSGDATWTCNSSNTEAATTVATDTGCRSTAAAPGEAQIQANVLQGEASAQATAQLVVLEASTGSPALIGELFIPHGAEAIYLRNDHAVILTSEGLRMVDISNPVNPTLGATVAFPYSLDLDGVGDTVLFAGQNAGLYIMDISNPESPFETGHLPSPLPPAGISAVAVSGNTAYVANGCLGFHVVDIANPTQPQTIGSLVHDHCISGVTVHDNHAYLAGSTLSTGLLVVDVSHPASPVQVGQLSLQGGNFLAHRDDHVYIAGSELKLAIADVTNPALPQLLLEDHHQGWANKPVVMGTRLYVPLSDTDGDELWVDVYDIADPANVVPLGTLHLGSAWTTPNIALRGQLAYISDGSSLFIYDLGELAPQ